MEIEGGGGVEGKPVLGAADLVGGGDGESEEETVSEASARWEKIYGSFAITIMA